MLAFAGTMSFVRLPTYRTRTVNGRPIKPDRKPKKVRKKPWDVSNEKCDCGDLHYLISTEITILGFIISHTNFSVFQDSVHDLSVYRATADEMVSKLWQFQIML